MIAAFFKILFGFLLACLTAALVLVCFVITPADIMAAPTAERFAQLGNAGLLTLLTATHVAIFSAIFALVAIAIAAYNRIRDWIYYAIAGNAIALLGFIAQYYSETTNDLTIVNTYAFTAYALAGFVGGLVYWYVAGARSGRRSTTSHSFRAKSQKTEEARSSHSLWSRAKNKVREKQTEHPVKDKSGPAVKFRSHRSQKEAGRKPEGTEKTNKVTTVDDNDPTTEDLPPRVLRQDPKVPTAQTETSKIDPANDDREPTKKITLQEALDELDDIESETEEIEKRERDIKRDDDSAES